MAHWGSTQTEHYFNAVTGVFDLLAGNTQAGATGEYIRTGYRRFRFYVMLFITVKQPTVLRPYTYYLIVYWHHSIFRMITMPQFNVTMVFSDIIRFYKFTNVCVQGRVVGCFRLPMISTRHRWR